LVSVSNNAIAMPFNGRLGILHSPVHPGFSAGYADRINRSQSHQLFFALKLGYFFQQRVQHAIHCHPEIGYRFKVKGGFGIETRVGAGYMHSVPDLQQFKLANNGGYERRGRWGKPSLLGSLVVGVGYDLEKRFSMPMYLFTQYQVWLQSPFVRSYVPILPNATLHIGSSFYFRKNKKTE
ncbi:MAG: hypothetical protein WD824_20300, partial [Cyclobacteriaceae bacterium]